MIKTSKKKIVQNSHLYLQNWSLVTSITKPASKPSEIRGVLGVIQQYYFTSNLGPPVSLTTNRFFKCHYFPPDHILGIFRKSSPAIRLKFNDGYIANDPKLSMSLKNKLHKSLVPVEYSFIRVKLRRIYRQFFYEAYQKQGKDGLYVFYVDLVPNSNEDYVEFQQEIDKTIKSAHFINSESNFYKEKVMGANLKADWKYIRKLVESEGLNYPQKLITLGLHFQAEKEKFKSTGKFKKLNKLTKSKDSKTNKKKFVN